MCDVESIKSIINYASWWILVIVFFIWMWFKE
jgi:hypothetical protein